MTNEEAMKNIRVLHCGDYDCQLPENEADAPDFWCKSDACEGCFHFLCHTALREQAEREKGCEHCADREDLAFGHDSTKRAGSIYIDGNLLVADLYSESMAVAVCYCPMCGKSLKEAQHE